jgi:transducin (beta)-like 1
MIEISKDEINGLIQKYLEDEGYYYTLFTFKHEASIANKPLSSDLLSLLKKGMQYLFGIKHLQGQSVVECSGTFTLSSEHVCDLSALGNEDVDPRMHTSERDAEHGSTAPRRLSSTGDAVPLKSSKTLSFSEKILNGVKNSSLVCWNGDNLAIYTTSGDLFAFYYGNFLWKKQISNVTAIAWHNEDLALGNINGEVITINISNSRTRSYVCHTEAITQLRLRGKGILSAGVDGRITVMNNGVKEVAISDQSITDVVWITEDRVGCCLSDFSIVLAKVEEASVFCYESHRDTISNLSCNKDVMATSSYDGTVGLWNTSSYLGDHIGAHSGKAYDHKWIDERIVSCGSDGGVKVWDLETKESVFSIMHPDEVLTVDYNSGLIASGSRDGSIILSDPRCGEVLRHNINGGLNKLVFSPSGTDLCICCSNVPPKLLNLKYS